MSPLRVRARDRFLFSNVGFGLLWVLCALRSSGKVWISALCLHCISFFGLLSRILSINLVKPKQGTTVETITLNPKP